MAALGDSVGQFSSFRSGFITLDVFLMIVVLLFCICASTFTITWTQFQIYKLTDKGQQREPPVVPYALPYLGSAFSMLFDLPNMHYRLARVPQATRPLRVKAGPEKIYFIFGSDNVRQVFSKHLGMRKRTIEFFHALDVPEPDLQILLDDNSGEQAKPKEGTNVPPEKRILRNAGEIFSNHLLAVAATKDIAEKFLECIPKQFGAVSDKEWTSIPLFKWMRREMVYASGKAFHGEVLFEQNPEWQNLLWGFDEAFPTLALNTPQWMAPRMYKLRDAYRDSVSKWYRAAIKDDDLSTPSDAPWTREWGSRFWREFVRNLIKSGFTVEGAARASLSTLWASHGNAIPSSVWLLFEILTRPPLLSEILKELVSATVSISPPGFDMNKLVKLPLLNACWQEILRLRVTALIFREVEEDMVIGKTLIERGSQIMLTNWPTHHSPNWAPFHPDPEKAPAVARFGEAANVMEFDPMRFIAAETVKADKNASKEDRARATAALQPNNFMPWGGGNHKCSGRVFAKQEVFIAVAMFLVGFDIEVVGWEKRTESPSYEPGAKSDRPARADPSHYGFGILSPDRDLRLKIKRKPW